MTGAAISDADIEAFTRLAAVLIPWTSVMPAVGELGSFDRLLRTAVKA